MSKTSLARRAIRNSSPLQLPGCELSAVGMVIQRDLPFEEWQQIGTALHTIEGSVLWWIGDWLNYGERKWKETYEEAALATGLAYGTLRDAVMMSKAFSLSRRRDKLTWSHHREVCSLHESEQDHFLDEAEKENWSRAKLRQALHEASNGKPHWSIMRAKTDLCAVVRRNAQHWPVRFRSQLATTLRRLADELEEASCA
jgi:hypothetical protein